MAPALWKKLYNIFDPKARLETQDQDLFIQRPGSVAQNVLTLLREGLEERGKWVVCGSAGSGKSSELVHLAGQLQGQRIVIGIDLPRSVARVDLLRPPEVLFLMGLAALRAQESWGQTLTKEGKEAQEQLFASFHGLLEDRSYTLNLGEALQGVVLFAASLTASVPVATAAGGAARAAAGALGSKAQVKRPGSLGGLTRITREGEPDMDRLIEAVNQLLAGISNELPPVLLVDGLDKIQSRQSINELFAGNRILAAPSAPVVYTGPITLMLSSEWQAAGGAFLRERLTNVAVYPPSVPWVQVGPEKLKAGEEALRDLVRRRLSRIKADEAQVFAGASLAHLLLASGGLLRDVVQLINRATLVALNRRAAIIDESIAAEAITEIRKEYEVGLNSKRVAELVHVREHGEPTGEGEVSLDMLLAGYVLPYSNGGVWFEPHPILRGRRPGL